MRIGFLTPSLSLEHGNGHYSLELARSLRQRGIQVDIVTTIDSSGLGDLGVSRILPVSDRPSLVRIGLIIPRVARLLRGCDIIHCAVERYSILTMCVSRRRPSILTAHGSFVNVDDAWKWPLSRLYRIAFYKCSCVVCVSRYTAERAQTVMPGLQTVVISPGVSIERFDHLVKRQHEDELPTILCVAAIKRRKGIVQLVRAVATVREHLPSVRCIIIGSHEYGPDYLAEVQLEITKWKLWDCVQLLGHVDETTLLKWYSAADIFVLPAVNDQWRFEGYGLAYLEAGAAGLPVIGTVGCGAEDAIEHGSTGLLVSQKNLDQDLPKAILTLLQDREMRRRMGQAGRHKAENQTWQSAAEKMIAVYRSCRGYSG